MPELFRLDIKNEIDLGRYIILSEMISYELENSDLCLKRINKKCSIFIKNEKIIVAVGLRGKLGLIGICWGHYQNTREFIIEGLYVKRAWREFGYARMLKDYLEGELVSGTRVTSHVHITNTIMNKLISTHGYRVTRIKNNQTTYSKVV